MRLRRMLLIVGCLAAASLTGCATTATGSRGGGATSTPALTAPATPNAVTTSPPAAVVPSAPPAVVHTTAPPVVHTTAPPLVLPTTAAPAPVGCMPLTNSGGCYEPGEFCRTTDHGAQGVAGDGKTIVCEDNGGWRWEPVP
ncbi:MAG TPA: hypothetical protein VFW71_16235 [Actinomycetota bacterium]|nr:hypothetical protein [Actinomycetota bacterium]